MSEFKVYGKPNCPYCVRAMDLLDSKGIKYEYIDVTKSPEALKFIKEDLGCRTVPQIFEVENDTDMEHIGGFDDLVSFFSIPELQ